MNAIFLVAGVVLAIVIISSSAKLPSKALRTAAGVGALAVLLLGLVLSSARFVGEDERGIVSKNIGKGLPPGKILAVNGEKGPQAKILGPGLHLFYWPGIYKVEEVQLININAEEVGILTAKDGQPLPAGQAFAPEWAPEDYKNMLTAEYFLGEGNGYKGPQASVLTPGKYPINTKLFDVKPVKVTNIEGGFVGVVKSNVGVAPDGVTAEEAL
ncbi:MAG: hypothetical protein AAF432_09825, partial [Planctomycetota bacterium]